MTKKLYTWIFSTHSEHTIRRWAKQLDYFHFKRAYVDANDGDSFEVAFLYVDRDDLIEKLERLGIILNIIPDDCPRPEIGKPYSGDELYSFKAEIGKFTNLEQPGHCLIFGLKVFIYVRDDSFVIIVHGTKDDNLYEVSEVDFESCLNIEKRLKKFDWQRFIDNSFERDSYYVSRKCYPELYDDSIMTLEEDQQSGLMNFLTSFFK